MAVSVSVTNLQTTQLPPLKAPLKPAFWTANEFVTLLNDGICCSLEEGVSLIQRLGPIESVSKGALTHLVFKSFALDVNAHGRNYFDGFSWASNEEKTACELRLDFPRIDIEVRFNLDEGYERRGRPCLRVRCYLRDIWNTPVIPDDSDDETFEEMSDTSQKFYTSLKKKHRESVANEVDRDLLLCIPYANAL
jgi:hypothetical protein